MVPAPDAKWAGEIQIPTPTLEWVSEGVIPTPPPGGKWDGEVPTPPLNHNSVAPDNTRLKTPSNVFFVPYKRGPVVPLRKIKQVNRVLVPSSLA